MTICFLAAPPGDVTVAATVGGREAETFATRIEASSVDDGRVVAYGAVCYRIEE